MPSQEQEPRRAELARFLRTRRERLSPAEMGLPAAGRRRTPGLRREELALLAGLGTSWYTWLEQGRAITVSAQALESLARALRLTPEERAHLFILARGEIPASLAATTATVDAATQQMLDALNPCPAYVVNAQWTLVAWNTAACRVFVDFASRAGRERNLLWLLFTDQALRERYEAWEEVARRMLGVFRVSAAGAVGETWYRELIQDLGCLSHEFSAWWPDHDIASSPREAKVMRHPLVGRLVFASNPLQVAHTPDAWMLVYTPDPATDTRAKVERLLAMDAQSASAESATGFSRAHGR
jgi:transcriptional regulator with XRE-family HTH domain